MQSDPHRAECTVAFDTTAQVISTEDYVIAARCCANMAVAPANFRAIYGANEPAIAAVQTVIAEACGMPLT